MNFPEHRGRAETLTDVARNFLQGLKQQGGAEVCLNPNWIPGVYKEQCTRSSAEFKICLYTYIICGHWQLALYHPETHKNLPEPEGKHISGLRDKHEAAGSRHLTITWFCFCPFTAGALLLGAAVLLNAFCSSEFLMGQRGFCVLADGQVC